MSAPSGNGLPVVLDARVVSGTGGGPEKTILNSPRFLLPAGFRNICAYMHPPGDPGFEELRQRAELKQAPLLSVPDRGAWDWKVIGEFLNICRRERVKIWHGHDYKSNALGLLLKRFWPMKLVTTVHGWVKHTKRTPLYYGIDRWCLPRYESVICVSDDLYRECLDIGVPAQRCVLIENGIDTEEYTRSKTVEEAKRRFNYPPERFLVGAVGRLSEEKGFEVLIRAVDGLIARGIDVGLWIIGEGDQKQALQGLITKLGQSGRIRLLGYRPDTLELYQAMDVYALSSYREGLPNVLLESLALEVPTVATRVNGVPRLIRNDENGLLVEPGSSDELGRAIENILLNQDLRNRLQLAGRRTIETSYSFAVRMEKVRAVYDKLLHVGPGREAEGSLEL